MGEDRDTRLVAACLNGDRDAYSQLAERYQKKLYNAAYRITGSREDAMDATQTALMRGFERMETFNPAYRFFSWIYRITVNESLNLLQRRGREAGPPSVEPVADAPDPARRLEAAETGREVQRVLMELSEEQRVVIVLRHFHGFSYAEMAEVIEVPAKTVKSRLFSARRRLQQRLEAREVGR